MKDNLVEFAEWWKSVYKEKLAAVYIDERFTNDKRYEMKPYLILLKYNGYTKTVIINHMTADLALTEAYRKFPDVKKCNIIE